MFEPLPLGFPTGGGTTANPSPKSGKVCFLPIFGRFFHLPNGASKFTSKKHRKMSENRRFCSPKTLPKPSQNAFKIASPKNTQFLLDFYTKDSVPQTCRHWFRIGFYSVLCLLDTFLQIAFCIHFGSKMRTKNPSKTRSEPSKNRCKKRIGF